MVRRHEPAVSSMAAPEKPLHGGAGASWLIPTGLLLLCLLTAAAFFLATSPRPAVPATVADLPPPSRGGVLRLPIVDSAVVTLDPVRATRPSEIMLIQQIFDGLTALDRHLNVVPSLARYWEISSDGRTYTFELRHDAVFHNGRPVTAEDCVFSFERLLRPGLNANNYHYFSRIEGARAFREGLSEHVSGLRALDKKTFQIRFTTPFVPALSVLSMYCSKVLPKSELLERGEAFFLAPVGTGPFRFERWIGQEQDPAVPVVRGVPQALSLSANRRYFGSGPFLDGVVFRSMANQPGTQREEPFTDVFDYLPYMGKDYEGPPGWTVADPVKLLALYYLVLPANVPPFNDRRLRRAVSYALDKSQFLSLSARTADAPAAASIVPPGIPGFLSLESSPAQDLERAKQLLAEAGYPMGKGLPPLEVIVYPHERKGTQRACLKKCLAKIGLRLKELPADHWIRAGDPDYEGRPILYRTGWIADFPDPDNFLRPLFHSASPANLSGYNNPEIDRLLDQVWSETSYSVRNRLYHRIEKTIRRDSPIIPLYYDSVRYLLRSEVRGFSMSPMGPAYIQLNRVWLSKPPADTPSGS